MATLKKILLVCLLLFPLLMLSQEQVWHKTEKEVKELLLGEWKTESYTFEGEEQKIDPKKTFGLHIISKTNDSLKISELSYFFKKVVIKDFDLNLDVEKVNSEFIFCIDYKYKDFCQKIKKISATILVLEEGPNTRTLKKVEY